MAKKKDSLFVCQQCGNETSKWAGQCPYCGEWNSLTEVSTSRFQIRSGKSGGLARNRADTVKPIKVSDVIGQTQFKRFSSGFDELDRVFGETLLTQETNGSKEQKKTQAGLVPGSVTLLSGEPGMGKSTLLSQMALKLAERIARTASSKDPKVSKTKKIKQKNISSQSEAGESILYVCGEESIEQVKMRLERLSASAEASLVDVQNVGAPLVGAQNVEAPLVGAQTRATGSSIETSAGTRPAPASVGAPLVGAQTVGAPLVGAQTRDAGSSIETSAGTRPAPTNSPQSVRSDKGSPFVGNSSVGAPLVGAQTVGSPLVGAQTKNNDNIFLLPEIICENITDHILKNPKKYKLVIIDSIQSVVSSELNSFAGSISQVRECGLQLTQVLKKVGVAGIIIGHVTKGGNIAGPKTLEHMVDAVFRIEGERTHDLRLVRSLKNRFGTTDEVGVFRMTDHGLVEVGNAADVFLENVQSAQPGSVLTAVLEGNRVMLLEIQALVVRSNLAVPRRVTNGIKVSRLQMILAVLQKQLKLKLGEMDVFINVAGGVNITEPAADLAVALAVISSIKNKTITKQGFNIPKHNKLDLSGSSVKKSKPVKVLSPVVFGELGLLGEIRPVIGSNKRARTAKKLGYSQVIGIEESNLQTAAKLI